MEAENTGRYGRPRCSRNTNVRVDPAGAVPAGLWHIADREESTKSLSLFRLPIYPSSFGTHRHSGFANDNEPGITIHIT